MLFPQEKLKTMLMQNFGVTNKEYYGMLKAGILSHSRTKKSRSYSDPGVRRNLKKPEPLYKGYLAAIKSYNALEEVNPPCRASTRQRKTLHVLEQAAFWLEVNSCGLPTFTTNGCQLYFI